MLKETIRPNLQVKYYFAHKLNLLVTYIDKPI